MADEINNNLVFLIKNLTNLEEVLAFLIQNHIITENECEEVEAEKTSFNKKKKIFLLLQKKDWESNRSIILGILRETNNKYCADQIEGQSSSSSLSNKSLKYPKILKQKWWPEEKRLIKSLLPRKYGNENRSLVEELHNRISQTQNEGRIVICESPSASKYSGMGGMGKTLTAKWYANKYENEYDHIIWIDCGEGSLLKSFERLARDLEVKNRGELDLREMATKSFDELTGFRCLWIYDNAENYKGKDGIINFLPKCKENFHCIITSRSRDWGTENVGFGKIAALELDIFSDEETLAFLKSRLDDSIEHSDSQLKELGRLTGNLPLALQLALAALNNRKIDLQNYIEKTSSEDLGNILDEEFDDYEKTINKNVKISLDLILKQENGKLAYAILMIFGYIQPDDVRLGFLMKILNIKKTQRIEGAIHLLEKYGLVKKTGKVSVQVKRGFFSKLFNKGDEIVVEEHLMSIHRLLQQVIRHNGRGAAEETLRKILGCPGFIDYKLLPFTKYAKVELQKDFPKVKAELLDQEQLRKLIGEERFDESVRLAKFIFEELQTNTSIFNYVICLARNEQLEESVDLLEKLEKEDMEEEGNYRRDDVWMGMLNLTKEVSRVLISGHLLDLYGRLDNKERMQELLENRKLFEFIDSRESFGIFIKIIRSDLIKSNYYLEKGQGRSTITFKLGTESKKIDLKECSFECEPVQLAKFISEELQTNTSRFNYAICLAKNQQLEESVDLLEKLEKEDMEEEGNYHRDDVWMGMLSLKSEVSRVLISGHLLDLYGRLDNKERMQELLEKRNVFKFIDSDQPLEILVRILHSDLIQSNYSLSNESSITTFKLGTESKKIDLSSCSLDLDSFDRISPTELTLWGVSFTRGGEKLEEVRVNEFIDLDKINRLTLTNDRFTLSTKMCLDLSGDVSLEYLFLSEVRLLSWKESKWNIQTLRFVDIPFMEKTKLTIKEMEMIRSSLNISCLPRTLQKLDLGLIKVEVGTSFKILLGETKVVCTGEIDLPNLNYLTLFNMDDCSFLSSFHSANLTHIYFVGIKEVNVNILPKSVTHIKITGWETTVVFGVRKVDKLDKLILEELLPFSILEQFLSYFQTDELAVYNYNRYKGFTPKELIELTKKEIKRIAVGVIEWGEEDFSILSSHIDRKADFYLLEGGRGRGIGKEEFEGLMKLY